MQLKKGFCKGPDCVNKTDEVLIVNQRYQLCDPCNFKRLHYGKSKEEVYRERIDSRARTKFVNPAKKKSLHDVVANNSAITKASKISSVSSEKRYKCSDGSVVSQVDIKRKLAEVYDQIKQEREPVCQGLGIWDAPLSFSHTISQARCKELGKTELIWDKDNLEIESFEAPTSNPTAAHNIWEVATPEKKMSLLNFNRKLKYIELHDPEEYNRWMVKIESMNRRVKE